MDFKKRPLNPDTQPVEQTVEPGSPTDKTEGPVINQPKRSRAKLVLSVLLALVVIAAGALAYLWWQERQAVADAKDEVSRLESINQSLRASLAEHEEQSQAAIEQPEVIDQSEAILVAGAQHVCQADECANTLMEVTGTVYGAEAIDPSFAIVSVDRPGDFDSNLYLKKDNIDGLWEVVHEGDDMTLNQRNQHGFPAELFGDGEQ